MTDALGRARFGDFEFDPESGELRRGTETSRLQPQPAQVLGLLLRHAGDVVTREDLKREVWPETVVEFDQGLNYCIRQIRAALGDAADVPMFVETLPRRGYRFIVPVEWATPARRPSAAMRALPVLVGAALTVLVVWLTAFRGNETRPDGLQPIRVAVLPLREPRPGGPLTEGLVAALTNAGAGLDVVGPATTAALRGDSRPHTELGAELGVAYVISGGIRADSSLFVQAVRVPDGAHVFARVVPAAAVDADSSMRRLAIDLAGSLRKP